MAGKGGRFGKYGEHKRLERLKRWEPRPPKITRDPLKKKTQRLRPKNVSPSEIGRGKDE